MRRWSGRWPPPAPRSRRSGRCRTSPIASRPCRRRTRPRCARSGSAGEGAREAMASTETQPAQRVEGTRPRIGLLGIMQALYDDMLPGITERQAAYAAEVAAVLGDDADVTVAPPVKTREDADRALHELEAAGLDGVLVVML